MAWEWIWSPGWTGTAVESDLKMWGLGLIMGSGDRRPDADLR